MIRVNAIFPQEFLKRLSAVAKEARLSRSAVIRKAVLDYLERYEAQRREKQRRKVIAQAMVVQDTLRHKVGRWDGVHEIRRWRDTT